MCFRILSVLLGGFFVFIVATVAAFAYLPWWQALIVALMTFLVVVVLGKYLIKTFIGGGIEGMFTGMFRMKGRVLHNATIRVHGVQPTETPEDEADYQTEEFDEDEPEKDTPPRPLHWFAIDVTITPDSRQHSQMTMWDIDDLMLVPLDAPDGDGLESLGESDEFGLSNVRIVADDGEAVEFEEDKVLGPRRLRFAVGIPAGVKELKFRYYFETFGKIRLPDPLALPPAP